MSRTPDQEVVNQQIWNLHVHGKTALAAKMAHEQMRTIEKIHPHVRNPDFYCNTAMQEGKLSLAAAHLKPRLADAIPFLKDAAERIVASYPFAKTLEETQQREEYWRYALLHEAATLHALGDVLRLATLMEEMFGKNDMIEVRRALLMSLIDFARLPWHRNERTSQIFQLKSGTYEDAQRAYFDFLHPKPPEEKKKQMADQKITMAAMMLGRAMTEESSVPEVDMQVLHASAREFLRTSIEGVRNKQVPLKFVITNFFKSLLSARHRTQEKKQHQKWGAEYKANPQKFDTDSLDAFAEVLLNGYIGLDEKTILQVRPRV